jgi:hypothetical protein
MDTKSQFQFLILTLIGLVVSLQAASAQLRIAPLALFMSDRTPMERIIVENMSNEPREISISLRFGYPTSDSAGNVIMVYRDTIGEEEPSATEWIRVYPRQIVLHPGERQTFRFLARPPATLPEGEYWVRPVIHSQPFSTPVPPAQVTVQTRGSSSVGTRLNVMYETVISINFRKGRVGTGVAIRAMEGSIDHGQLSFMLDLERQGNAAYIGNMVCRLYDDRGQELYSTQREIAVYYSLRRRFTFGLPADVQRKATTMEVELNTERTGNKPGDILQASPVARSFFIRKASKNSLVIEP